MQIGTVANKAGLSVDTIRFYERNALLPRAPRSEGGFRQYGEGDIETLGFVRRTQGLGFTLGEVRELLALRQSRLQPCAPVRRLEQKLVLCMTSSPTFRSWSVNCGSRSEAATENCTNDPRTARFWPINQRKPKGRK